MLKKFLFLVILAVSVGIAGLSYQKVDDLSKELVRVQEELKQQSKETFNQLDSQIEKMTGNIVQLKKDGFVESADLSNISVEVSAATVLIAGQKDIENIKKAGQSLVVETIDLTSAGTGFIVKNDGYIVTAKHVIDSIGTENIVVLTQNGKSYFAQLIQQSDESDVALLKIDGKDFPTVKIGYFENISIGEKIGFIGYSLNTGITKAIVYEGSISAKGTDKSGIKIFSINAFVNRGNSGGPVFSANTGRVIGMISARQRDISSDQFIKMPSGYSSALMLGSIDPVKFNVDLYNQTVKLVGDVSQVGIGLVYSLDEVAKLLK